MSVCFCMCVCVCVCVFVCVRMCFLETHNFIVLLDSDMAYVISFAEDTYDFNPSAILVSGIQKIWQSSCVRFEFLFRRNVTFLIRVPKCVTATTNDGILFTVHKNLGDAWHNVWLPLGIVGSVCDAQLQFEIVYDATYDYRSNVALGNVIVLSGSCIGDGKTIICEDAVMRHINAQFFESL